jgi:hypothetical protein
MADGAQQFTVDEIKGLWEYLTPDEQIYFHSVVLNDGKLWRPLPGPQTAALRSKADIIGFGGQAGGGKSDLLAGAALMNHERAVIFRKEKVQTEAFIQRFEEIIGSRNGYNSMKGIWRFGDRRGHICEFAGLDNPGDEKRWQGRPHDLKGFDEVTEMREHQVRFAMGWNRTSSKGQRIRVIMTFNPPTSAEGRWVVKFFAPWIDDGHPNPADPGELRWFTTIGDDPDYEVPDSRPFVLREDKTFDYDFDEKRVDRKKIIRPKSRTFIPASVTENPFYSGDTDYIGQLQSMPEPLRSMMLYGDFKAGQEDHMYQVIPTKWIDMSMDRWVSDPRSRGAAKGEMSSMGVDAAAGGKDNMEIARRHGTWFDDLITIPGKMTGNDGAKGGAFVLQHRRNLCPVHVDVIGWGSGIHTFLVAQDVQSIPVNWAEKSLERANDGKLPFANKRAEHLWRLREALDPANPDPLYLPDDAALRAQLMAYRWTFTTRGILIGSKDEMRKPENLGYSPDKGDAVALALLSTVPVQTLLNAAYSMERPIDRASEIEEMMR